MIKKLERTMKSATSELGDKINEIIDYLQAKEEPSKGECKRWCKHNQSLAGDEGYFKCNSCNPPEHEEEWERDFRDKVDDGEIYGRDTGEIDFQLRDYIRDNFVSKSKLAKYVQEGIDECNEPGKHIGGVAVLREMQMALGLGD